jgi:hypothetical protein
MHESMQVGLFTYALILGLVAEAVQSASDGFKKGNGEVVEEGHTVILHTNNATKRVLRQARLCSSYAPNPRAMLCRHARCFPPDTCMTSLSPEASTPFNLSLVLCPFAAGNTHLQCLFPPLMTPPVCSSEACAALHCVCFSAAYRGCHVRRYGSLYQMLQTVRLAQNKGHSTLRCSPPTRVRFEGGACVQWARGQSDRGRQAPIVILSNKSKAELDKLVTRIRMQTGLDVQVRVPSSKSLSPSSLLPLRTGRLCTKEQFSVPCA